MNERPTPETTAAIMESRGAWSFGLRHKMEQLERERDEARKQLNRTSDELYEEQQNHGITKGHLTECRMEANDWWSSHSHVKNENKAMREAIKEAHESLEACIEDSGELLAEHDWWKDEPRCGYQERYEENKQRIEKAKATLAKLQPFLA